MGFRPSLSVTAFYLLVAACGASALWARRVVEHVEAPDLRMMSGAFLTSYGAMTVLIFSTFVYGMRFVWASDTGPRWWQLKPGRRGDGRAIQLRRACTDRGRRLFRYHALLGEGIHPLDGLLIRGEFTIDSTERFHDERRLWPADLRPHCPSRFLSL